VTHGFVNRRRLVMGSGDQALQRCISQAASFFQGLGDHRSEYNKQALHEVGAQAHPKKKEDAASASSQNQHKN